MAKPQSRKSQQAEKPDDGMREKMISINRVTKVVKGGRILGFAALTVVGDGDGRIGMGKGKSREVPVAVQKAMEEARRKMVKVSLKSGTLHHTAVKVSVGDTFAETPASKDSYETTDLGRAIEKADYKMGEDGGVIAFIVANKDKNIQLQFIGDRTYKTAMQPNDRKAIAELTELARILSGMEQIRKDKKEANLKIEFVTRKMQEQEEEK